MHWQRTEPSKDNSCRELSKTLGRSVHDLPEVRAADVAVHRREAEKLRVIEGIEQLHPELERLSLRQAELLLERRIEVPDAHGAQFRQAEQRGVERRLAAGSCLEIN